MEVIPVLITTDIAIITQKITTIAIKKNLKKPI
jgi:hypothetical protein